MVQYPPVYSVPQGTYTVVHTPMYVCMHTHPCSTVVHCTPYTVCMHTGYCTVVYPSIPTVVVHTHPGVCILVGTCTVVQYCTTPYTVLHAGYHVYWCTPHHVCIPTQGTCTTVLPPSVQCTICTAVPYYSTTPTMGTVPYGAPPICTTVAYHCSTVLQYCTQYTVWYSTHQYTGTGTTGYRYYMVHTHT